MAKKKKKPRDKKKKPAKKESKNLPIVAVVGMYCPDCGTGHEFDIHEHAPIISFEMQCRKATCGAIYNAQFRKNTLSLESMKKAPYILTSVVRADA